MKYAVFIEPELGFSSAIQSWKEVIEETIPGQPYCCHPPHATVYYGTLASPENWEDQLVNGLQAIPPISCNIHEKIIFYDDAQVAGAHTMAYKVAVSPELFQLQMKVATLLKPHILEFPSPENFSLSALKKSCMTYGWPFVGPHWIPHFTIAALHVSKQDKLIHSFLDKKESFSNNVSTVTVWQVEGDSHIKIKTISLGRV